MAVLNCTGRQNWSLLFKVKRSRKTLEKKRRPIPSVRRKPIDRLAELAEAQEILLPELAARIAALEHLLLIKGLCSREELKDARTFIDTRRVTS